MNSSTLFGQPEPPTPEPTPTETPDFSSSLPSEQKEILFCPKWLREKPWTNATTIEDIDQEFRRRNIPGIYFVSLQMVLGLIGNVIVMIVYCCRFKASNYRVYVLFLAFLDLINVVIVMPFAILYLYFPINFPSNFICKAGHFVGYFAGIASPLVLVLIAIDRFRKVCRPLKKQISEKRAKLSCLVIVLMTLSVTWFTPWFYGNSTVKTNINDIVGTRCFREMDTFLLSLSEWYYIVLLSMFTIVTFFLAVLYFFIMRSVHSHSKFFSRSRKESIGGCTKSIQTRKTTVTFLIITIVYVISTITHDSLATVLHFNDNLECDLTFNMGAIFYTFLWSVFLNNVSNPFIYGMSDDRFSALFKELFTGASTFNDTSLRKTTSSNRSNSKGSLTLFLNPQKQAIHRHMSIQSGKLVGSSV